MQLVYRSLTNFYLTITPVFESKEFVPLLREAVAYASEEPHDMHIVISRSHVALLRLGLKTRHRRAAITSVKLYVEQRREKCQSSASVLRGRPSTLE